MIRQELRRLKEEDTNENFETQKRMNVFLYFDDFNLKIK